MARNEMIIDTVRDGVVIRDNLQPFYRAEVNNVHIVVDEPTNSQTGNRKISVYIKPKKTRQLKFITDTRKDETRRSVPLFLVGTNVVYSVSTNEL